MENIEKLRLNPSQNMHSEIILSKVPKGLHRKRLSSCMNFIQENNKRGKLVELRSD